MVTLINEIWDIILDYLHDDKKSLSKCGLVTRGWLPTCRYHLFFELVLRLHDKTVDIKAIFRSAQDCGILPYVQKLAIRSGGRGLWSEEPIPHLPFFPCVREMTISHLDWTYILPKSEKWIVAQMANVAVFRIVECEVRELNRVSRVISAIPVLPHLCIQGGRWSSDKESQLEAVSTQFHELVLSGLSPKSYNTIYDWIYPFCEEFEVFKIFEDANSIIHVSPLLRTMATYLLHLTLQLPYAGNSDIQDSLLAIAPHFDELKTLTLSDPRDVEYVLTTDKRFSIKWIVHLHSHIPSPHLLCITFRQRIWDLRDIPNHFPLLDAVCDAQQPHMTRCRFLIQIVDNPYPSFDYIYRDIRWAIPRLDAQGRLECLNMG